MSPRPTRRRRRPTRVLLASLLLGLLAGLVGAGLVTSSGLLLGLGAVAGVVVGVVGLRLVYLELADVRRLAAADRAAQAVAHRTLSRSRSAEQARVLGAAREVADQRRADAARLEAELDVARLETARAVAASALLADRVAQAEQRTAQALVRLAEAEGERDALEARRRTARVVPGRRTA